MLIRRVAHRFSLFRLRSEAGGLGVGKFKMFMVEDGKVGRQGPSSFDSGSSSLPLIVRLCTPRITDSTITVYCILMGTFILNLFLTRGVALPGSPQISLATTAPPPAAH